MTMKNLEKIKDMIKKEFTNYDQIITTTILSSKFLLAYLPYIENLEEPVRYQEIETLMKKYGVDTDLLWEEEVDSNESLLIFREDDEKGYNEYLDQTGCRVDYEEEINQQRWFWGADMTEEERRKIKHIIFELKRFDDINPENYKLIEKALRLFLGEKDELK